MESDARLRVLGPAVENSVPADVLVRVVHGMQQTVWLIAAAKTSRTLRQRFKPDLLLRQQFTLRVAVPERGSYAMPMSLAPDIPQGSLVETVTEGILDALAQVWRAVSKEDIGGVQAILRDEGYILRVLHEIHRMLPRPGDGWGLAFGAGTEPEVELAARHRPILEKWLKSPSEERETAVIGELQSIDFAAKRVWILYPPTQQEIECTYRDEVEDTIIDARRGLFQITGQFVLDSNGHPKRLTNVRAIEPVDLTPVKLVDVELNDGALVFEPPLQFVPELDTEGQQYFVARIPELGLELSGRTRDLLVQDFEAQIAFVWREYALASEAELTDDACTLRSSLLHRARWISAANGES